MRKIFFIIICDATILTSLSNVYIHAFLNLNYITPSKHDNHKIYHIVFVNFSAKTNPIKTRINGKFYHYRNSYGDSMLPHAQQV